MKTLHSCWVRGKISLEVIDGEGFLVLDTRITTERYDPLNFILPEAQAKYPGEHDEISPAIAAANLGNLAADTLTFSNKWGLLGLNQVPAYISSLQNENQEQVSLFSKAIADFQRLVADISYNPANEVDPSIAERINNQLEVIQPGIQAKVDDSVYSALWKFPSLLSAMYLQLAIWLMEGKQINVCKWQSCGRYFINKHENYYCSSKCRSAHTTEVSRKSQWRQHAVDNLNKHLNLRNLNYSHKKRIQRLLTSEIDRLLKQKGIGEKKLEMLLKKRLEEEVNRAKQQQTITSKETH